MKDTPKIIDLFSGCGGFGLGAEFAGFKTVAAIDIDANLQSSYKLNFPETRVVKGDLSEMDADSWRLITGEQDIDGVIGGPPCQGFSRIGKRQAGDPRNELIGHYFRHVLLLQPKFFVMENVEGILDDENQEGLNAAINTVRHQYEVLPPQIIDASHYGAPTNRKRVVIVGYDPSRMNPMVVEDFVSNDHPRVTVSDAISDLPEPIKQTKDKLDFGWQTYRKTGKNKLSNYASRMRNRRLDHQGWIKSLELLAQGKTSGHFETCHSKPVADRFKATQPGKTEKISRCHKLAWNGLCPTLRAGTGSDKGSHQAVRPLHPDSPRVITVREAARLQGFPDWFTFHNTKWHSFRMIGNSVSPIVSEAILSILKSKIIVSTEERYSEA